MSLKFQEIIQKALLGMSGKIIRLLLNFATAIILGRFYGARFMGIYFLFISLVTILSVPVKLGMHNGILKMVSLFEMQEGRCRAVSFLRFAEYLSFLLWFFLTVLLIAFREPLTHNLFHLKVASGTWVMAVSTAVLAVVMFGHLRALFLALGEVKEVVWAEFIIQPSAIFLFFILLTGFDKVSAWVVPAAYISSFGLGLSYLFLKLKNILPDPGLPLNQNDCKDFLKLSIPLCLTGIIYMIMHWTDNLFVGYFHSASEVGIYNAASRVAAFLPFLMASFNLILPSRITHMHHSGQVSEMFEMIRKISRWNLLFSLTAYSGFIVFRLEIVSLFGHEFISAELPLLLLGGAQIFNVAAGPIATIFLMTGYERQVLKTSVVTGLCNIILDLVLIPKMGTVGAAVATGTSLILHNLLLLWLCRQQFKSSPYAERSIGIVLSFIGLSLVLVWCHGKIELLMLLIAYFVSMAFLVWLWLDKSDLSLFLLASKEVTKKMSPDP